MASACTSEAALNDTCPWPRQLLYIPTLTSFHWRPGNTYNDIREPAYFAITYTWGRWELGNGEFPELCALDFGTPWKIPRVHPDCFTPDQLRQLICKLPLIHGPDEPWAQVQFVWIDIACIDQRDGSREKDLEIGRQAVIFRGATKVYAWLREHTNADIDAAIKTFEQGIDLLTEGDWGTQFTEAQQSGLDLALKSFEFVTSDPWFSSLWTLQEAYLRPELLLVDRNGELWPSVSPSVPFWLKELTTFCQGFYGIITRALCRQPKALQEVQNRLRRTGLLGLYYGFPVELLMAAHFRTVSPKRLTDRVYGIMQVFDLKLGKSAPASPLGRDYNLQELEDQLGSALLAQNQDLSQMFVHTRPAAPGQAWRLSHHIRAPESALSPMWIVKDLKNLLRRASTLSVKHVGNVLVGHFAGLMAPLTALTCIWSRQSPHSLPAVQIDLDAVSFYDPPTELVYGGEDIREMVGTRYVDLASWVAERRADARMLLLGLYQKYDRPSLLGLILVRAEQSNVTEWTRAGICWWEHPGETGGLTRDDEERELLKGEGKQWDYATGTFG
ncbi:hypothetical protein BU26DRAFT_550026 [Trematosphaeria pertusa]|uniref:Heterokaryon incompatibility domain-containing protein n=1 Tax=Trematosphaeria pertusa TaxID=390896 RepID=A0A6A6IHE4_9PLEO|nr:uncharacterized protein BU26DRAFT_550026 [Trematosphaeria pertusa]KAF2249629.1 hypothetical protein BU26DRAFT_550026 [Trematosphaeria pertusa]